MYMYICVYIYIHMLLLPLPIRSPLTCGEKGPNLDPRGLVNRRLHGDLQIKAPTDGRGIKGGPKEGGLSIGQHEGLKDWE